MDSTRGAIGGAHAFIFFSHGNTYFTSEFKSDPLVHKGQRAVGFGRGRREYWVGLREAHTSTAMATSLTQTLYVLSPTSRPATLTSKGWVGTRRSIGKKSRT